MPTTIRCPQCSARLNITDPALLGKRLKCPKCQTSFTAPKEPGESSGKPPVPAQSQAPAKSQARTTSATTPAPIPATQTSADQPPDAGLGALDFSDLPMEQDEWSTAQSPADAPAAPAAMWTAPVREVEVKSPQLSPQEAERRKAQRDKSLLIVGGAVGGMVALAILIIGGITVYRSMQKNAADAAAQAAAQAAAAQAASAEAVVEGSEGSDSQTGKAVLPTIFGFDEARRLLLVDYLVSHGINKPKAKLRMAMVVNGLKKLANERQVKVQEEFPEELELYRERIIMRDVPDELLKDKVPADFESMVQQYQSQQLGPGEEEVAILVILAFVGTEM